MANGIRTGDSRGFNKGRSSKFREGSRVRQTPEEGRRTYRPKRCGNNNKDDNSPKNLNDKNQQASSWEILLVNEFECWSIVLYKLSALYRIVYSSIYTCYIIFYNELSSLVPKHNVLIISENMNAQMGKSGNKFCWYNSHLRTA